MGLVGSPGAQRRLPRGKDPLPVLLELIDRIVHLLADGRQLLGRGLVHHSDRGSQYASKDYRRALEAHGVQCSMSGKGNCYDNALKESFFHTLKVELVHGKSFATRADAKAAILLSKRMG